MTPSSAALLARARVVATAGTGSAKGATVLSEMSSAGPLILRRTGVRGSAAEVHLVAGAAGPLGGDHWVLDIEVGPGAHLRLRSVGATLALPDRTGAMATMEINVAVADGGRLDYACEPLVVASGAWLRSTTRMELAEKAGLAWREELVAGRSGEDCGDAELSLRVRHAGKALLAQDLRVGPNARDWTSAAVLGAGRALGTFLIAGSAVPGNPPTGVLAQDRDVTCAAAALAGPGILITATGPDVAAVRRALDLVEANLADRQVPVPVRP